MKRLILPLLLAAFSVPARAQQAPSVAAARLDAAPVLDGVVADDPAWTGVAVASGFTQTSPDDGDPASFETEVRVGVHGGTLFVGVILYDDDTSALIVADRRRDASLQNSDSFRFILDTFGDRQNGFVFGTNVAGAEYDAQFIGASGGSGFGGRMSAGSGGGLNVNWDASWEVVTRVHDGGWSVEFAIPFNTLRYPRGVEQTWGINFERVIRRNNETAFWAPLERQFDLTRVTHAGQLTGVAVPDARNLKLLPYVLTKAKRDYTVADPETDVRADFGADLKYSITPSLTLDATFNTDFAQVEVDEEQINLDRFSLFFPEKRPFFLENAGLFSVGEQGEAELFFSRRIGIDPNGGTVPILAGARLTGSLADLKVGVLEMQTESVSGVTPANNFGVLRLMREFGNRSAAGVLLTQRIGTSSDAPDDDRNHVGAVDVRWGIGEYGTVSGFLARSETPGIDGNAWAGNAAATWSTESTTISVGYTETAEAFNPELGFLRRQDYRKISTSVFRRIRPQDRFGLFELRPHVNYRGYWKRDGFQQTGYLHVDNHWEFRSGWEFHTGRNWTYEGVSDAFEIADGVFVPADEYDHAEMALVAMMPEKDAVRLQVNLNTGGFFGGTRWAWVPRLNMRWSDELTAEVALGHNRVDLPGGAFHTNLLQTRLSWSFTPRIYLQALGQYNDQRDQWSMNVRFGWLQQANTGLFVVFNSINRLDSLTMEDTTFPGEPEHRGLTIKYAYLFDVYR
ncbi:MAG: DUF5916 domain-containing protein [Bacteroidetes bacterium]|nr:DUF5916 domain-containing protein [Bacteroidota bacterium]